MYDPVTYWTKRIDPNYYNHVKDIEIKDLKPYVDQAETILDYGPGIGRLMPLYEGKTVSGYDIVDTYKKRCEQAAKDVNFSWLQRISGQFDLGVCTKVVLHEPNPKEIIDTLACHCDKVFISTAVDMDAAHCFNHDYFKLLDGYTIELYERYDKEVHIVYHS